LAADQNRCPRRWDIEPIPIFKMVTGVGAGSGTSRFRCAVPDPRVWVKFGVLWVPANATTNTAPGAATLTLWVAAVERGGIADQGTEYPVEDLLGTSAAPLAIPTNSALYGKFVQVKTGQTGLQAVMSITTPTAGVEGTWFAKASYYPTVDMPREEWDKLVGAIGGIAADNVIGLSV
jgi:hypothetical protein